MGLGDALGLRHCYRKTRGGGRNRWSHRGLSARRRQERCGGAVGSGRLGYRHLDEELLRALGKRRRQSICAAASETRLSAHVRRSATSLLGGIYTGGRWFGTDHLLTKTSLSPEGTSRLLAHLLGMPKYGPSAFVKTSLSIAGDRWLRRIVARARQLPSHLLSASNRSKRTSQHSRLIVKINSGRYTPAPRS